MNNKKHILIFEPQIGGHHLFWLQLICESFLDLGYRVTIAIDDRTKEARERIADKNESLLNQVSIISIYDKAGKLLGASKINAMAECVKESGADEVFCTTLDEFTSSCFRRAAIGINPPAILKRKLSGVYHRPRPIDKTQSGFGNFIKRLGFKRLEKNGWFKHIFVLDEYLLKQAGNEKYHFLPDPWDADYSLDKEEARKQLGIDNDKTVLLHYGTASKRKGLHLLLDVFRDHQIYKNIFILVAGKASKGPEQLQSLEALQAAGHGKLMNYYISESEEKLCFCATDFIALPYIGHYGSSGILSRAAAAGKPVIASDYHILGRRVAEHGLGLLFKNDNADSLKEALEKAVNLSQEEISQINKNLIQYAQGCSKDAFKAALKKQYL